MNFKPSERLSLQGNMTGNVVEVGYGVVIIFVHMLDTSNNC